MMQIGRIENATRVLGESQGFRGLPVRDETATGRGWTTVRGWRNMG